MTTTPRFTHSAGTLTLRLTANTYPASHFDAVAESNQKGRTTMSDRKLAGWGGGVHCRDSNFCSCGVAEGSVKSC